MISRGKLNSAENQHHLISTINDLNDKLHIEWNAVVAVEISQDMESVIQSLKVPVLIITRNYSMDINSLYRHQMMTIVSLEQSLHSAKVYEIVRELLKALFFSHILWIYPKAQVEDLQQLASRNWRCGYTKVLYYVQGELYTYDPVPNISIRQMRHLQEFVERKDVVDFKRYPVSVPVITYPPRCYQYRNKFGELIYTGYLYKMIRIFIDHYNFQFKKFPNAYASFNIKHIKEALRNKSIDIIPASFLIYDPSLSAKSNSLWLMKSYIMAPYPAPLSKHKYFLHPYKPGTALYIVILLLYCALAVAIIYYRQCQRNEVDFSKSALYVFALFMYQNQFNFKIKTNMQKLVYVLIFLNGFILTNLYVAKLSSLLVQNVYGSKIENLEDLNRTNFQLLLRQFDYDYLHRINVPEVILKRAKIIDYRALYKAQHDFNNTHLLISSGDEINFLLYQQRFLKVPRMYRIKDSLYSVPEFITVRRDLPYIQLFNRYLRYIIESGILYKFMADTHFDGIISGEIRFLHDSENNDDLFLSFDYFYMPLIFFGLGMTLALNILVLELLYFKYVHK